MASKDVLICVCVVRRTCCLRAACVLMLAQRCPPRVLLCSASSLAMDTFDALVEPSGILHDNYGLGVTAGAQLVRATRVHNAASAGATQLTFRV